MSSTVLEAPRTAHPEVRNLPIFCDYLKRIDRGDLAKSGELSLMHPAVIFSAEYGLPNMDYAGGLGMLLGDQVQKAADLRYPAIYFGLGYETRRTTIHSDDGNWKPVEVPLSPSKETGMTITIKGSDGNDWNIPVLEHAVSNQSTKLYVLPVRGSAYPGEPSSNERLANNIALGFGGYQVIKELIRRGKMESPAYYHFNEEPTVFGALAAINDLTIRYGDDVEALEKALIEIGHKSIFSSHTPVPAVQARYNRDQCDIIFNNITSGVFRDWLESRMVDGQLVPQDLAISIAGRINAVSEYNAGEIADIFSRRYKHPFEVAAVTNGIYEKGWNPQVVKLLQTQGVLDRFAMPIEDPSKFTERIDALDPEILRKQKDAGVAKLREYLMSGKRVDQFGDIVNLPEDAIVVGFARRVTSYKRWWMLFRNQDELAKILEANPKAHIIMSGQPHPNDVAATADFEYVKTQVANNPLFRERIHIIPNWAPDFAKVLTPACHVWINTPRVGQEACGTSGMKTGLGGALQVATIDGFYAELPKESYYAIEGQTDTEDEYRSLYQKLGEAIFDAQDTQKWADGVKRYWKGNPQKRQSGLHIASGARMLALYTNLALPRKDGFTPNVHSRRLN